MGGMALGWLVLDRKLGLAYPMAAGGCYGAFVALAGLVGDEYTYDDICHTDLSELGFAGTLADECPVTCNTCDEACSDHDALAQYFLELNGFGGETCADALNSLSWVGADCDTDLSAYGFAGTMAQDCPVTCGTCDPDAE